MINVETENNYLEVRNKLDALLIIMRCPTVTVEEETYINNTKKTVKECVKYYIYSDLMKNASDALIAWHYLGFDEKQKINSDLIMRMYWDIIKETETIKHSIQRTKTNQG